MRQPDRTTDATVQGAAGPTDDAVRRATGRTDGVVRRRATTRSDEAVRRAAFEAGLLALGASALYALLLVLLRTTGATTTIAAGCCGLLLAGVGVAARRPAAAFAALSRSPAAAPVLGALTAVGLAAAGPDNRLLFLPTLLLLSLLGTAVGARRTLTAAVLATAGLLAPLASDPAAVGDRRLLALTAVGLLAIPPLLALLLARASRAHERPHRPAERSSPRAGPPIPPAERSLPHAGSPSPPASGSSPRTETPPPPAERSSPHAEPPATPSPLTPRQLEAVALTAAGLRHAEIGERLGVSVGQVRRLLRQGRERVHASTTRELVAWAMMAGIVDPTRADDPVAETERDTESRPPND